jgi:hypothetical protein
LHDPLSLSFLFFVHPDVCVRLPHNNQHHSLSDPALQKHLQLRLLLHLCSDLLLVRPDYVPLEELRHVPSSSSLHNRLSILSHIFSFLLLSFNKGLLSTCSKFGVVVGRVFDGLSEFDISYCLFTLLNLRWVHLDAGDDFIQSRLLCLEAAEA